MDQFRSFLAGARARVSAEGLKRAGAALAAVAAVLGAIVGLRIARRTAQLALDGARAGWAALTLKLYRRCPDCRRWLRGDARTCWRCGWRRAGRRWPRPSARF